MTAIPFDAALRLIMSADSIRPSAFLPRRLDGLFRELSRFKPDRPPCEIQDLIWAVWTNHRDKTADMAMEKVIHAIALKDFATARTALETLIADYPQWPEVWNKKATLAFVQGRWAEAVEAIMETIRREPRHFGAMSGFAQICLRLGRDREALMAFEAALGVNPHLEGVAAFVTEMHSGRKVMI